jgi:uncharacterized protein DUF1573
MSTRTTILTAILALTGAVATGVALPPPLPPIPQAQPDLKASAARLSFEETTHDFGEIFDDAVQEHEFWFTNTGPDALIIGEIKSSCGCTVPELEKRIYQPGEKGKIKVIFNPHGKRGFDSRTVTIRSNDALAPSARITIKSHVRPLIIIEPSILQFGQIDKGQTREKEILIAGRTDDFKATMATTNYPDVFEVKIIDTKIRTVGTEKEDLLTSRLLITVKPDAPVGLHRAELSIRTNDPRRAIERTQVLAQILGDLAVVPPRLSLGRVQAGANFSREFKVQSRSGEPFKIKEVVLRSVENKMRFEFTPEDPKNPTVWRVVAHGVARADQRRIIGQILVRTDVKGEESIEVRFNGFVNPG